MGCSVVETFGKDTGARELEEVLRLEYRSKLLNPKWAQASIPDSNNNNEISISMADWGCKRYDPVPKMHDVRHNVSCFSHLLFKNFGRIHHFRMPITQ